MERVKGFIFIPKKLSCDGVFIISYGHVVKKGNRTSLVEWNDLR